MKHPSQQAVHAVWAFEIHHVKLATGFEHTAHLTQRTSLLFRREMVEHERRKHSIERRLGIRQLISKSVIELNRDRRALGLAPGSSQRLGVRIKPNHLNLRMKLLDQRGQRARAAAHVENALPRPQHSLIE